MFTSFIHHALPKFERHAGIKICTLVNTSKECYIVHEENEKSLIFLYKLIKIKSQYLY